MVPKRDDSGRSDDSRGARAAIRGNVPRGAGCRSPRTTRLICSRRLRTATSLTWSSRPPTSVRNDCALRGVLRWNAVASLVDDLSVVSEYLLLPEDSKTACQRWTGRSRAFGRVGATPRGRQGRGHPDRGAREPSRPVRRVHRGYRRETPEPQLDFLHIAFPTSRGSTCPRDSRTTSSGPTRRVSQTSTGSDSRGCPTGLSALSAATGLRGQLLGRLMRRMRARGAIRPLDDRGDRRPRHQLPVRREPARRRARNVGDIANVPLFVKLPGQQSGHLDDRPGAHHRHPPDGCRHGGMRLAAT